MNPDCLSGFGKKLSKPNKNAKLIAAAPDLLGVLKDIVYTWENFNVNRESQMGEAIQYAKEAIKKAGAE